MKEEKALRILLIFQTYGKIEIRSKIRSCMNSFYFCSTMQYLYFIFTLSLYMSYIHTQRTEANSLEFYPWFLPVNQVKPSLEQFLNGVCQQQLKKKKKIIAFNGLTYPLTQFGLESLGDHQRPLFRSRVLIPIYICYQGLRVVLYTDIDTTFSFFYKL